MNWPKAKRARTSSIFRMITPSGPYRTIGPQWQNSREKPHVLAFWPTLWPEGTRDFASRVRSDCLARASFTHRHLHGGGCPPLKEGGRPLAGFHDSALAATV